MVAGADGDTLGISIHAPREGSDGRGRTGRPDRPISIHAPREGSDGRRFSALYLLPDFYPRSPRGERPHSEGFASRSRSFLSTLPARGATGGVLKRHRKEAHFYPRSPRGERRKIIIDTIAYWRISIHAPREGSDQDHHRHHRLLAYFYPRSPRGERPVSSFMFTKKNNFYPRSPRGERLRHAGAGLPPVGISIHAPREGSDIQEGGRHDDRRKFLSTLPARGATVPVCSTPFIFFYFYPRSPRGERPATSCAWRPLSSFLSTLPARGATLFGPSARRSKPFLSTLPARGATPIALP